MVIKDVSIKNFRLLENVSLNIDDKSTVIVGRNNTGKTSLTEIFRCFLNDKSNLHFEDFSINSLTQFENAYEAYKNKQVDSEIRKLLPEISLELKVNYNDNKDDFGILSEFILDLDDNIFDTFINFKFCLADGRINNFFEDLNYEDKSLFYRELKKRIVRFYESQIYAVDPSNAQNFARIEFSKVKKLLVANFINAQRGLDDETHNEKDVLGKSLGNIFKSSSLSGAPAEFKEKSEGINSVVDELQLKVDNDFQLKVKELLPTLSIFGYPGLSDPNLSAVTELNVKSLLESNTRILYKKKDYVSLPETYNGLGARNLIFILFRIYEYFRYYQSLEQTPKAQIIFIEEPEAHLHPQMQEVFIRQLDKIVNSFEKFFNNNEKWPVQFVVSTHSTHIANEVEFNKIRYFLSKSEEGTKVKDLSCVFILPEDKDKEFIYKYLTLTKCDLYFADRAVLIEGATERILFPEIIEKFDTFYSKELSQKYLSIVEIGGAYAHHFYKFLDFLELKTLIITDIDAIRKEISIDISGQERTNYKACPVSEGTHSSNIGISKWFDIEGYSDLDLINKKTVLEKVKNYRRLAYQIPEDSLEYCGRSFEDAFILANGPLFADSNSGVNINDVTAFNIAKNISKQSKADFAIEYAIIKQDWITPKYIIEGLMWLSDDQELNLLPPGIQDEQK